jgi:hypothetical protein
VTVTSFNCGISSGEPEREPRDKTINIYHSGILLTVIFAVVLDRVPGGLLRGGDA